MTETSDSKFRPSEGGSYFVGADGKVERREFTRAPDHPEHELNRPAAPPAKPGKPVKES